MDNLYYLFIILAFLATVLFVEGLYLAWNAYRGPEAKRIEARLQAISASGTAIEEAPLLRQRLMSDVPFFDRMLLNVPRIHALDRFVLQSGLPLTVGGVLGIGLGAATLGALAAALLGWAWYVALAVAAACAAAWAGMVQYYRARRLATLDRQLPETLDLMARAMQAGHAFSSALRLAGSEGVQPIAREFQMVFDEINFGMSVDQALGNLATRTSSRDLRFFVVAVLIQRESGGNLAEILTSIARLVRERQKLAGTVRVLSAEARLSAWILTLLPFGLGSVIVIINRAFISKLWTDPIGIRLSAAAMGLMVIGIFWMWRMVRFRV